MKCADVAKAFVNGSGTDLSFNFWIERFRSCEDFTGNPEKFEEIWDCRDPEFKLKVRSMYSFPYKSPLGHALEYKRWHVTFKEMPE
jgi:hypothetical protein